MPSTAAPPRSPPLARGARRGRLRGRRRPSPGQEHCPTRGAIDRRGANDRVVAGSPKRRCPVIDHFREIRSNCTAQRDLNLRPPGPQPERPRRTESDSAFHSGLSCSEVLSVALSLDPGLDPVHGRHESRERTVRGCQTPAPRQLPRAGARLGFGPASSSRSPGGRTGRRTGGCESSWSTTGARASSMPSGDLRLDIGPGVLEQGVAR